MRKNEVRDLDTLNEYYDKVRKIRFEDNIEILTLDDIYNSFFSSSPKYGIQQHKTVYSRGGRQCDSGRYRSIDDFIKIVKKYFPEKTLKDIFQYLKEKEDRFQKDNVRQCLRYCGNIKKYNFSGLVTHRYGLSILDYNLRDLNPNVPMTVSELLT